MGALGTHSFLNHKHRPDLVCMCHDNKNIFERIERPLLLKNRAFVLFFLIPPALLCLGAVFYCDPAASDLFPPCPSQFITGFYCPGCGTLRAIHNLLHGRFCEAFSLNALAIIFIPIMPILLLFPKKFIHPAFPLITLIVIIAYAIARNTETFSFLAPH